VNVAGKSPSPVRVAVIAGAFAVLASAVTPAYAAAPAGKVLVGKKRPPAPRSTPAPGNGSSSKGGGTGGPVSLDWTISATLRP
jgi:hypothetical protein